MTLSGKVLLGTASFGAPYGLANIDTPSIDDVKQIISISSLAGFGGYDTARDYGDSEQKIGSAPENSLQAYTKFSHGTDMGDIKGLREQTNASAKSLGIESIRGISPHSFMDFALAGENAPMHLGRLKSEGLIDSWGLSLYEPQEFFHALEIGRPDYIQIPLNVLDRRFATSGAIARAKDLGIGIQVRSIYLQGALLQSPDSLPPYLAPLGSDIEHLRGLAKRWGVSMESMLLIHAVNQVDVDHVVVGVNSSNHVRAIQAALESTDRLDLSQLNDFHPNPTNLVDPRTWSK